MNFNLSCPRCEEPFDAIVRMPRMLTTCGHTLCNSCLGDLLLTGDSYACPDDGKVWSLS